jgi:molybdenum cofactor cytidylyltransferase
VINALVLAAGESKRMGMPKPLLRFGNTTFLAQIVSVLQQSEVDGVTVVLGAQAARIRASADLAGVDVVMNEDYRNGQLSSLTAGLKSLPSQAEALLLCLVDNPLITGATVNRVVQ